MTHEEKERVVRTLDAGTGRYYVYALCKRDGTPFYIGKGCGWRVFQHREAAQQAKESIEADDTLDENAKAAKIAELTQKLQTIIEQEDNLQMVVVKWGLSSDEAFMCESSLINLLSFLKGRTIEELTNIVNGHASEMERESRAFVKTKARTLEQFLTDCAIETLPIDNLWRYRFVVININAFYRECLGPNERPDLHKIGESVRAFWWLGNINQTRRPDYILATYRMRIVGIFHVVNAMTINSELQQGREPRFFPAFPEQARQDDRLRCAALSLDEARQNLQRNGNENGWSRLCEILRREQQNAHSSRPLEYFYKKFLKRSYFQVEEHGVNVPQDIMRYMNCIPTKDGTELTNNWGGVVYRHLDPPTADTATRTAAPGPRTTIERRRQEVAPIGNDPRLSFWHRFKQWCRANHKEWCTAPVSRQQYYNPMGIKPHIYLFFTIGDRSGDITNEGPLVTTGIYCRNGVNQRESIRRFQADFNRAFADCPPDFQDWTSGRNNGGAKRICFIRRRDWEHSDESLFARMAADLEAIQAVLERIPEP